MKLDPRLTATALSPRAGERRPVLARRRSAIQVDGRGRRLTSLPFNVRDHGPALLPADLPHLFERFFRGAAGGQRTAGTGMGLAIARGLLAAEAGPRSGPRTHADGGATFTIAIARRRVRRPPIGRAAMTTTPRILLVDDEVSIQRAVAPLLRSRGYDVDVAGTGREALAAVAERPPDLMVLDLGLPDLEGTDRLPAPARRSSRCRSSCCRRGCIESDKVGALDLGADDYVTKPFSPRNCWRASASPCAACFPRTTPSPGKCNGRT